MQSVIIITIVSSSIPPHGDVYTILFYVITFVRNLLKVVGFSGTSVFSTNKSDSHDITEQLKVALHM